MTLHYLFGQSGFHVSSSPFKESNFVLLLLIRWLCRLIFVIPSSCALVYLLKLEQKQVIINFLEVICKNSTA